MMTEKLLFSTQVYSTQVYANTEARPTKWMIFLHGIMGSGANFRTLARKWVQAKPDWGMVLVDLPHHGRSIETSLMVPTTLEGVTLALYEFVKTLDVPICGIMGHSFGGKIALSYLELLSRLGEDPLQEAWILDSNPGKRFDGRGSETTLHVLQTLRGAPKLFSSRNDFTEYTTHQGLSTMLTEWLAMNVEALPTGQYSFRLDVEKIADLLEDYFRSDLWHVLNTLELTTKMNLILGGKSNVFSDEERAQVIEEARTPPERFRVFMIPEAGHWLHVDAPGALLDILTKS